MEQWLLGLRQVGNNHILGLHLPTVIGAGAQDAGKIVALNSQGIIDPSLLPATAQGGVEIRDASNQVMGQASVLRAGDNIVIELTGGIARISALQREFGGWFDPILPDAWLGMPVAYTPL